MSVGEADPKGLIRESYRIDAITEAECRSIFVDWALSLPVGVDAQDAIRTVLLAYEGATDHPMSVVLAQGLTREGGTPARRGGWRGRRV
ncbi:hypothetical protein DL1_04865 [Thioclava dalianensis]|uniref:Uncharacterized protein n=2 Tax=Thioclava dalianensis TaxID=1185766 RepID=A0A074TBT8_9RHOB|nr:hypothetical protein DL1_04865 [Thioclava dalianensis]